MSEAHELDDFEKAFNGEQVEDREEIQEETEEETNETQEEPESLDQQEDTPEESSVDSEIQGLSPEALSTIESKITSAIEQKLSGRLRNLEGNFGGIKQKLDMMATAQAATKQSGSEAPTSQQIKEASTDGEKMQALREDFPEFADALDELRSQESSHAKALKGETEALQGKLSAAERYVRSTATELQKLQQIRYLDKAHPDWEDVIQTEEYTNWLYNQPPHVIDAANNSLNARDAIEVLNAFKKTLAPKEQKQKSTTRLEDAITPTSGGHTRPSRKTENEEFEAAFKAAR